MSILNEMLRDTYREFEEYRKYASRQQRRLAQQEVATFMGSFDLMAEHFPDCRDLLESMRIHKDLNVAMLSDGFPFVNTLDLGLYLNQSRSIDNAFFEVVYSVDRDRAVRVGVGEFVEEFDYLRSIRDSTLYALQRSVLTGQVALGRAEKLKSYPDKERAAIHVLIDAWNKLKQEHPA